MESQGGLERPTDLEQKVLNLGAPFWGLCLYFPSACSPFTCHLILSRVLGSGLKESKEGFVLQKESKESFVGLVLNKIIKTDKSIPLPQGWFPRVGAPQGKRETKKIQGDRTGFLGQSFLKDCLLLGGTLTALCLILLRKVASTYTPHRLCVYIYIYYVCICIGT